MDRVHAGESAREHWLCFDFIFIKHMFDVNTAVAEVHTHTHTGVYLLILFVVYRPHRSGNSLTGDRSYARLILLLTNNCIVSIAIYCIE